MAWLGWCTTGQHGYPAGDPQHPREELVAQHLCPGTRFAITCQCPCHTDPDFVRPAPRETPAQTELE